MDSLLTNIQPDKIQISSKELRFEGSAFFTKDNDGFYLIYSPTLEIVGYGKTKQEAFDSFKYQVKVFLDDISMLSVKKRMALLHELGWVKDRMKNKKFTHPFIDADGKLQNFNHNKYEVEKIEVQAC